MKLNDFFVIIASIYVIIDGVKVIKGKKQSEGIKKQIISKYIKSHCEQKFRILSGYILIILPIILIFIDIAMLLNNTTMFYLGFISLITFSIFSIAVYISYIKF